MKNFLRQKHFLIGSSLGALLVGGYFGLSFLPGESYDSDKDEQAMATSSAVTQTAQVSSSTSESKTNAPEKSKPLPPVTHIKTPSPVKGIYMTACVLGTPSWRERLADLIQKTELNSVVIDIKDYSGTISFLTDNPALKDNGGTGCRAKDVREFVAELHEKGIYVIGRITVFQDPYYTKTHPELAVKKSDGVTVWKDRKGLSFIDVGAKPFWEYIIALSKESYAIGFDELNFDYIRFPSDGDMKDIDFTWSKGKTKAEALKEFWKYLHDELAPTGAVISADLFGMTTTNTDDLNIGQVLENALPYFDYIDPMVYPSHYPTGFNGWKNPNDHVYDVVHFSMSRAAERATAASTTPLKLRPWLQDFNYGGVYGPKEVRAQIQATYDSGLTSWLIWDPGNKYTSSAATLEKKQQ